MAILRILVRLSSIRLGKVLARNVLRVILLRVERLLSRFRIRVFRVLRLMWGVLILRLRLRWIRRDGRRVNVRMGVILRTRLLIMELRVAVIRRLLMLIRISLRVIVRSFGIVVMVILLRALIPVFRGALYGTWG